MQSRYGVPEIQNFMVDGSFSSLLQNQLQQQRIHPLQSIPVTQQFFQQHPHRQFQLFQQQQQSSLHQQLGFDGESGPEQSNSTSRIISSSESGNLSFMEANFKVAVAENKNSGQHEALNDDEPIAVAAGEATTVALHPWQQQTGGNSSVKEPFWKPLDIEYMNRNNKRCKEKLELCNKFNKKSKECNEKEEGKNSDSNYGLFGELEAIYAHSNGGGNNQTAIELPGPTSGGPPSNVDHGPEASNGEEAMLLEKIQKRRRKKKRKLLNSIATFFEALVEQLMDHQESLNRKFLEAMERRDEERRVREEAWRQQEAAKSSKEVAARTQERALAAIREAAIVALLEKITGETINLPSPNQSQFNYSNNINESNLNIANSRRWPKSEVQALIQVRSGLELKFQQPGLKGPLWEEVSSTMAAMGYERSAKRCKEKWENINKYFRKTKDTAKKRSQPSRTCPYFHQLHQLYSKSSNPSPPTLPTTAAVELQLQQKDGFQLLDAIVMAPTDETMPLDFVPEEIEDMRRSFKFAELVSMRLDNEGGDNADEGSSPNNTGQELFGNDNDNEDDDGDGDDEDSVEKEESENQENVKNHGIRREEQHQRRLMFFWP